MKNMVIHGLEYFLPYSSGMPVQDPKTDSGGITIRNQCNQLRRQASAAYTGLQLIHTSKRQSMKPSKLLIKSTLALALGVSALNANANSITTTFAGNTTQNTTGASGNMFNVTTFGNSLTITGLDFKNFRLLMDSGQFAWRIWKS